MECKPLGCSGLMVSELCLGTMIFGDEERGTDEPTAIRMVHQFLDAGGNFIDTADVYVGGYSEEITGKALKDRRDRVVLATKVRFAMGDDPNAVGLSRRHVIAGCEASLRRLGTDHVDLLYVHMWDPVTPIEETLRALDDLVTAGKVRYIGVSNFKAWQVMKALAVSDACGWARFIAAQYQYSLVVRDIEREFVSLFEAEELGQVPWGPLGGGFLSGKYRPGDRPTEGRIATTPDHTEEAWHRRATERNWAIIDAVGEIAAARDKSYPQVALAWLLAQPTVVAPIIGVRTPEQLEDNLGAVGWRLSDEELARLREVSAIEAGYPYRMIREYGAR
ncbi:MAG: aldo/keto reductase [Anaerolineae bacterium]|nr:aldo/keto reductase [Anaerolineae bacterium]